MQRGSVHQILLLLLLGQRDGAWWEDATLLQTLVHSSEHQSRHPHPKRSCALVVSRGGFALARNTSTVLRRRRCPPPAAGQQSWTRLRPMIRWLAISRAGGQAPLAVRRPLRGPTQRAARRSARQPENNSSTLHELAQSIPPKAQMLRSRQGLVRCRRCCNAARAGAAITAGTGAMYKPRTTLSSRKQSRRPHEYLTPLLTAEAGQQWGHKDGATTMCLEPCLDRMCCVLQLHVKTS